MNQIIRSNHKSAAAVTYRGSDLGLLQRSEFPRKGKAWSLPISFQHFGKLALAVECALIVGASLLSGVGYNLIAFGSIGSVGMFFGLGVLVYANFLTIALAQGSYRSANMRSFRSQAEQASIAWLIIWFVLLAAAFSSKISNELSRGATITFFAMGWAFIIASRSAVAFSMRNAMARSSFAEQGVVVIAQEGQVTQSGILNRLRRCGYRARQIFEISNREISKVGLPLETQNTLDEVIRFVRSEQIEQVFLVIKWDRRRCIEQLLGALEVLPVSIHLLPDENVARYLDRPTSRVGTVWAAELKRAPLSDSERFLKRSLDIVIAAIALLLLWPLMLVTTVLIKLGSPGPAIFTQTRNGFNGRGFRIFKFRTMRVQEDGPTIRQATRNDSRVTRLGRILRRTSIDELPQLFNVIMGDMSVVGPRPHAAAHNSEYEKLIAHYAFRYHVKPGITGWAQVNGCRGETQTVNLMTRRVDLDLWYINHWSFWLDLAILVKTMFSVFDRRGAY
jgi:Undecaprenyl-phosphate glucose phosphotransferase